jgi:MYXO-CTERM domain-containing protein
MSSPAVRLVALVVTAELWLFPRAAGADIGARCETDADCGGPPEVCLVKTSDAFGGGPAGGFCTVDCAAEGPSACDATGGTAVCQVEEIGPGESRAWCVPACTVEEPNLGKCTRDDLACFRETLGATSGRCLPLCNLESDCGEGRCDVGTGLCVDALPEGERAPVGAPCDPGGPAGQCDGACEELTGGFSVCTALCVLGSGLCAAPSEVNPSFCLLPGDPDLSRGDAGFCLQVCDCNDDCTHPDAVCADLGPLAFETTGHAGACLPRGMTTSADGLSCETDAPAAPPPDDPDPARGCACRTTGAPHGGGHRPWIAAVLIASALRRRLTGDAARGDGRSAASLLVWEHARPTGNPAGT